MSKWWIGGRPFTCRNARFQTNIKKGKPHGVGQATGSVFDASLVNTGRLTLWLEYAEDHQNGGDVFWLMWYDHNGAPTIPLSGVFDLAQLQTMNSQLSAFIKVT